MGSGDAWDLVFAGYPPSTTTGPGGTYDPDLRVPYFVPLHVAVPQGAGVVAGATGEQLATWITPELG